MRDFPVNRITLGSDAAISVHCPVNGPPRENPSTTTSRVSTLSDHRNLLKSVFRTARERVIVVSPFISNSALNSDSIPSIIRNATGRGVSVSVYTDSDLNRTSTGEIKPSAAQGVSNLVQAGAKVFVANGIHNKTLIRDNDLIAEGSFNWLSAVRTAGALHQREERTMVVEGEQAKGMVEEEVGKLGHISVSQLHATERVKTIKTKIVVLRSLIALFVTITIGLSVAAYKTGGAQTWMLWSIATSVVGVFVVTHMLRPNLKMSKEGAWYCDQWAAHTPGDMWGDQTTDPS